MRFIVIRICIEIPEIHTARKKPIVEIFINCLLIASFGDWFNRPGRLELQSTWNYFE
jgi:hypothetical protein